VDGPADPRLDLYRGLKDPARRAGPCSDGAVCVVEGKLAVSRLLGSMYAIRSLLVDDHQLTAAGDLVTATRARGAPVFVGSRAVVAATVGFALHRGVVAVATGDGIGRIFRSLGVHRLLAGGQTMNPSTADLLEAVESLRSAEVVILPNNKNIRPVAEQVDALSTKVVRVVPTNTVAEGFGALLAYDPEADAEQNAVAMTNSAQTVVAGEVTRSVRDTESDAGPIRVGDWIGLSRRGIEVVSASLPGVACALLERLVTVDHELVTLIEGEGSGAADTRRITEWLREHRPGAVAEVHHGGQPLYPYLFSIE
jgi:dihydroxyacetone kinase-like predicted kinase